MLGAPGKTRMINITRDRKFTLYVRDFTRTPGPRLREDGKYSGEEFREDYLLPRYREAVENGSCLHVVLEKTKGYASSFLEEAFGGLIRNGCNKKEVKKHLKIHSDDRPWYESEVFGYIDDA